jgi:glycosyltransferase involved in cell wall biosynthesis
LQATIAEYEIEDKVEFVPCQPDIKPYFEHASGYIMASECEGLGRVTAEAMFYGCPVVAHASGGTLDLVKDGITGYLFHTVDECADLINKVCNENQEKVILQAQQFAVEHLSQEVYGPKIMEVYESVLNEK